MIACLFSLVAVGIIGSGCSKDENVAPTSVDKTASAEQAPAKAKGGGGMMPLPQPAKPGEKTGLPK